VCDVVPSTGCSIIAKTESSCFGGMLLFEGRCAPLLMRLHGEKEFVCFPEVLSRNRRRFRLPVIWVSGDAPLRLADTR